MYNHMTLLKRARIEAGLTQAQVARDTGHAVDNVNRFENGAEQNFRLFVYYITHIFNDIHKQMLIDCIIRSYTRPEDENKKQMLIEFITTSHTCIRLKDKNNMTGTILYIKY